MTSPHTIPGDDDALLAECRVETFRAGGKGGQHQNTTETGVRLIHLPTGLRAEGRSERSQLRNRIAALRRLRSKLEAASRTQKPRTATRVPRAEKRKRLEQKRRTGEKKRLRRPPERDD